MKPTIAFCSDDPELYLLLRHILEAEGYATILIAALSEINDVLTENTPQAIVVDCSAGNFDAIELCGQIKSDDATRGIPIAALISPQKADQFVRLINAGVDDGFVRPLGPDKLLHFLRRATSGIQDRSSAQLPHTKEKILRQGDLEINFEAHYGTFKGRRLDLTPIGFRLLRHLLQYPNCVHSREELADLIWNDRKETNPRMVDVHVSRLRKSLQTDRRRCPIKTVRSYGYILEASTVTS
ncbi:response regulator transcription factor [Phyllobacterium zundukense]|uniref:DNA-binding response regulator n=1 Tax=Phyllobacterium zundukense TaxID=1867719 RepID=A0A2N9W3A7_9HYPH|nr:response regulator transcription factor [Phyllobacterium zundukense]ATU94429.1 hypothetical protein BLM14_22110 [Phyllobacterium zundukense]PIO46225.1 hypothetical protein B5P45_03725 [Phyllobacterium zundukense]